MKTKIAVFKGGTQPIAQSLPSGVAASIGRTIVRYTYLESILAGCIHKLLEISIKQGRVAVKLPLAHGYQKLFQTLLQYHGVYSQTLNTELTKFGKILLAAETARNIFAHSLIIKHKDTGRLHIQVVRGDWDLQDQQAFSVNRALQPETQILDRTYLRKRRAEVEAAIKAAQHLATVVAQIMRALNEKRRTQSDLDRRSK